MALKNRGKCYETAAREFMEMKDNALLVHGAPWSHKFGQRIGHAWIEKSDVAHFPDGTRFPICTVIDLTQPPEREKMPAPLYYHAGKMTDEHVTRYTKEQMCVMMLRHKNYGPWEGPADAALRKPKRVRKSGSPRARKGERDAKRTE